MVYANFVMPRANRGFGASEFGVRSSCDIRALTQMSHKLRVSKIVGSVYLFIEFLFAKIKILHSSLLFL